jgi:undecaprenyl-diphosphatase
MTYLQALVIGLLQGVTELFPISSLGHSVLIPALLGWNGIVGSEAARESFYLAFLVGLHVATALALLLFFRREWVRIVGGGWSSLVRLVTRRSSAIETADQRLFWLLVVVTVPVGAIGLAFEHSLRVLFAKPTAAAIFLFCNGLILFAGERLRRRDEARSLEKVPVRAGGSDPAPVEGAAVAARTSRHLATLGFGEGFVIGCFQSLALLAGISRSGVTMVGGLVRGLSHEDAARFSFLAATPVILAAGLYKLHDLVGANGHEVRGQILLGSLVAAAAAYASVRFLVRFFETRTLTPFAIYCLVAGAVLAIRFGIF